MVRRISRLVDADLDIVSAEECTGGFTSGDHYGNSRCLHVDINLLADGSIRPYVDAFKHYLTERRYADAIPADAATMHRNRRLPRFATRGAVIRARPHAHSCGLRIGVEAV
jgi:hypothetical protein